MLQAIEPEEEPEEAIIGPLFNRGQAREWALVLQSQSISFVLLPRDGGWVLRVNPTQLDHALEMIELYEEENENWPPESRDKPRHESSIAIPLAFISLALFYFYATGPVARGSMWFTRGRADALLLVSEPWRMITALTLHADGEHIIGNMISGTIFGTMVARRIGPGGALLATLIAGTLGNTINAIYHLPEGHRSIGASTAVFAAVGILAAVQTIIDWGRRKERRRYGLVEMVAPILGGLTLLGMLGAGKGNTDVWAHGFGFASGIVVGAAVAIWVRKRESKPSQLTQGLALAATVGIVGGAWALAIL
jgi:membrane associated rhomboid family serine protease